MNMKKRISLSALQFTVIALIFLLSYNFASGWQWAKAMGGTGADQGNAIVVDATGNVYSTGLFSGTADFDPGVGIFNLTSIGNGDIFISKLDFFGNFIWAKSVGGTADDASNSIAVDASSNIYITGRFVGTVDFDPDTGVYNLSSIGGFGNIFISKFDSSGHFIWAKQIGGAFSNSGLSIALDESENVFTTGFFSGTVDFDPGPNVFNLTGTGSTDVFVSKLNSSGDFVWAKSFDGISSGARGYAISIDHSGNVLTTGSFVGVVDFDPGPRTQNLTSSGIVDIFISKLDSAGNYIWSKRFGGTQVDYAYGLSVDRSGSVYTTGFFTDTVDFNPNTGINNLVADAGSADIFISKLDSSGNFIWAKKLGGPGTD
jgi:hypothetical protein